MRASSRRAGGFTLIEVLTVIIVISILVALLLPGVQAAREATRRTQCSNRLRNVGLALHLYSAVHKGSFPIGTRAAPGPDYGQSWTISVLPYLEQENIYQPWRKNGGNWSLQINRKLMDRLTLPEFDCPSNYQYSELVVPLGSPTSTAEESPDSSSTPNTEAALEDPTDSDTDFFGMGMGTTGLPTVSIMAGNFVGIAGAVSATDGVLGLRSGDYIELRQAVGTGTAVGAGIVSSAGALFPEGSISLNDLKKDGTGHQILVAEQLRQIVSGTDDNSSQPFGYFAGSKDPRVPVSGTWNGACHAITTVRTPIGHKTIDPANGIVGGGLNCGISSAHTGGAQVVKGDGSVQFLMQAMDQLVLFHYCIRDDGGIIARGY